MPRKANQTVVAVAAFCLLATHAFVSSGFVVSPSSATKGRHAPLSSKHSGSRVEFQAFGGQSPDDAEHAASWSSVLTIAVAFGLVVGVTSSPVRAEDVATKQAAIDELKKSVEADVSSAATPNQMMATKAIKENSKTKGQKSGKTSSSSEGGVSVFGGSEKEAARPAVLNPSDDVDDDERGFDEWTVRNPGLFLFFALIPTFIYLFFWVAGSLEIL